MKTYKQLILENVNFDIKQLDIRFNLIRKIFTRPDEIFYFYKNELYAIYDKDTNSAWINMEKYNDVQYSSTYKSILKYLKRSLKIHELEYYEYSWEKRCRK